MSNKINISISGESGSGVPTIAYLLHQTLRIYGIKCSFNLEHPLDFVLSAENVADKVTKREYTNDLNVEISLNQLRRNSG